MKTKILILFLLLLSIVGCSLDAQMDTTKRVENEAPRLLDQNKSLLEISPPLVSIPATSDVLVRYCLKDQEGNPFFDNSLSVRFELSSGTSVGDFSPVVYNSQDHCYESEFTALTPGTSTEIVVKVDSTPAPVTHPVQVIAPRLNLTGNSHPSTTVENRVFPQGGTAWNLTGDCDPLLGGVKVHGGINAETTTPCNQDGTFSLAIYTDGATPPYFIPGGDPLIQVKQGQLEPRSTRLYMTQPTWTNVFITDRAGLVAMQVANSQRYINYFLKNDIDLATFSATNNFVQLGTSSTNFWSGRLYGDGRKIQNLHIDGGTGSYKGLIGYANGQSYVYDLTFENAQVVNAGTWAGILAGMFRSSSESKISRIAVKGSSVQGNSHVGLVAGEIRESFLHDSWSSGSVAGTSSAGGLVGTVTGGKIYDSWSDASVNGGQHVGGFVGYASRGTSIYIERSFAMGAVSATVEGVGGFVGLAQPAVSTVMAIKNNFALGAVTGVSTFQCYPSGPFAGGLTNSSCVDDTSLATENYYLTTASCVDCTPNRTGVYAETLENILAMTQTVWDYTWKWKLHSSGTRPDLLTNPRP